VAIDIGGTFTDLIALDEDSGETLNIKVPSTPREPAKAVLNAFQRFLEKKDNAQVSVTVHVTADNLPVEDADTTLFPIVGGRVMPSSGWTNIDGL